MASVLRSERLIAMGFKHGFSLRFPGHSQKPLEGLNLARDLGDEADAVRRNHQDLAAAVGYDVAQLCEIRQVHGNRVLQTQQPWNALCDLVPTREADALVSRTPGEAIAVRVADCVPLLLADEESGDVAAIHAGWRGVAAGVIGQCLTDFAGRRVHALIGPHIGTCCFEVGDEVVEQVLASCSGLESQALAIRPDSRMRCHLDLEVAVRQQLSNGGVVSERVERLGGCTRCEPEHFFSYRRDGINAGRHLAVIVARSDRRA